MNQEAKQYTIYYLQYKLIRLFQTVNGYILIFHSLISQSNQNGSSKTNQIISIIKIKSISDLQYKHLIIHLIIPTPQNLPQSMDHSPYHSANNHLKRAFSLEKFQTFFINSKQNFPQLTKLIKQCNLDDIHCRFNVWRLCLGVVNPNSTEQQKRAEVQQSRKKYQEKKQQATKSQGKKSPIKQPVKKNPLLMMGPIKPQQNKQVETDQFLKQQIHKDVERTYQEMKFFQEKAIIKLLDLLLFVWCRRNPQVSYKQGMNELLASVVVCYFKETEFRKQEEKPEHINKKVWESHLFFNSVEYAESDIFSVFQKIIDVQGDMYKTEADLTIKSKVNPNSKNNTPILQRIIHIKDHKLKHMDLELFRILKLQDVQTKSFMLRWIRCMHTREFDLDNSFIIWDSIFLEFFESENSRKNKQFQFIDGMCLAMFMYMRSIVFTKETAGEILQVYQKYPPLKRGAYLEELITLAWTICEELALQSYNSQNVHQNQQSNWFEESSKVKALHFMEKKSEKKPSETQVKNVPLASKKPESHVEKQLKEKDNHSKNFQPFKKNVEPNHHTHMVKPKAQNHSDHKIKEFSVQKKHNQQIVHKLTPDWQKDHHSANNTTTEESFREAFVEQHEAQQERYEKSVKQKEHSLPSHFHAKQTLSSKVPQNETIILSHSEITQILQNLNESLSKVRDIDAQSLIRRTIKKIQGKLKSHGNPIRKQQPFSSQNPHDEP